MIFYELNILLPDHFLFFSTLLHSTPELVVEIVSPSDNWPELHKKIDEYLAAGVNRVWLLDSTTRTVRIYKADSEPQKLTEKAILKGEGILAGFELEISRLFQK